MPTAIAAVFAFSLFNALCEEVLWRGLLGSYLISLGFSVPVAGLVQAASFGVAHFYGYPSGLTGVLLTFIFGLTTWWVLQVNGQIRYAILSHLVADIAIGLTLIGSL